MIISVVSQKGGVGKSSLARTIAVEFTRAGWEVLLADTDHGQSTSERWNENRRKHGGIKPEIKTATFPTVSLAIEHASNYDLVVIDGAPHATRGTAEAAKYSDLIIIPTGSSIDDIEPGVLLANDLAIYGNSKIAFSLIKTTSQRQDAQARETISAYGYTVLNSSVPVKTGYITALDSGRALTETDYDGLNEQALKLINDIFLRVQK